MNAIEVSNLQKSYGDHAVVKGIDLVVNKGEIFGFLGRNGAGKSTFINMLTGIITPTRGTFSLLEHKCPSDHLKKRIGVMPDYTTLYSGMTALEHLKYFSEVSGNKQSTAQCLHLLELVGLKNDVHKKTGKFSFGMKKKLGIALSVIHNPELIFLDEPTSGLDAESVIEIHRLIILLQKQGKTIFMTSHNLHEVEKLCNRIAIMKDGVIVKLGTIEQLRRFYRSTITVKIKHLPIPSAKRTTLNEWLEKIGNDMRTDDDATSLTVDSEEKIAQIVRAFNQCKVDVLRVEVDEPTLEEIFLQE